MIKSLKLVTKGSKQAINSKGDNSSSGGANIKISKQLPFKLLSQKGSSKSKCSNRRSLSGSNKTGRNTSIQSIAKKKLKTIKGSDSCNKDNNESYLCMPQFPNNMHAAKAFAKLKNKLQKTESEHNPEHATDILKDYIRKFMK